MFLLEKVGKRMKFIRRNRETLQSFIDFHSGHYGLDVTTLFEPERNVLRMQIFSCPFSFTKGMSGSVMIGMDCDTVHCSLFT